MANDFSSIHDIAISRMRSAVSRMLVAAAALGWLGCGCLGPGSPAPEAPPRKAPPAAVERPDAGAEEDGGAAEAEDPVAAGRALEAGDTDRARRLASCDGGPDARAYLCARIAEKSGDPAGAVRLFDVVAGRVGPLAARARAGRTRALAAQGRALAAAGRHGEAVAALEAARAAGASGEDLELDLATALAGSGDARRAIALLRPLAEDAKRAGVMRRALERLEELGAAPRWSDGDLLERARRLTAKRAYDDAAKLLARLAGSEDREVAAEAAWLGAVNLYERRRHYREAAEALHAIAAGRGGHAEEARWLEASALARDDREEEAIAAYRKLAGGKRPAGRGAEALFLGSRLSFYVGRHAEALAGMERLVGPGKTQSKAAPKPQAKAGAKPQAKAGIDPDRALEAHFIAGMSALLSGKPGKAERHFSAASDGEKSPEALARNRYWLAVARTEVKKADGLKALEELCAPDATTWYAAHARRRLRAAGAPEGRCALAPVPAAPAAALRGGAAPTLGELSPPAALLAGVGLYAEAAEELRRAEGRGPGPADDAVLIGHYLALDAPHHAVRRASRALPWPPGAADLARARAAYPEPFAAEVPRLEAGHGLPRRLLYAIARKESLFDPGAVSPSGALGMMQMMPHTYEANRKRAGLPPLEEGAIPGPAASLEAAAFELEALLGRFGGSLPLAVMAYNGGASAVSHWVERTGDAPLDVFVEKAGFVETRNYVRRVYQNLVRYALLAGEEPPPLPESIPPSSAR